MNSKEMLNDYLAQISQREFDVNITKQQLMTQPMVVGSWGAHKWGNIKDKMLVFQVSGYLHTGSVVITLGWEDLYTVTLLDINQQMVGETVKGVYAEDLVGVIDELVETPN